MYKFQAIETQPFKLRSSKILNPEVGFGQETAQFRGSLLTLFGEPNFKTSNAENAFQYTIRATDDTGQTYTFTIYEGSSGLAIGSHHRDTSTHLAAQTFVQYVKGAPPADFEEKMVYGDTGSRIVYGCKDGVCYYNETLPFSNVAHNYEELPQLSQSQLDEVLAIDFSNTTDEDSWFWKEASLKFSNVHFPSIRDLMRKDLSLSRANTISLREVNQIGLEEGFRPNFSANTPEKALIASGEVWAWKTTAGKATQKRRLDCSSFAWTLSRAVYGFHGGNLSKNHARANALYEAYENNISSQENTLRFFYALLDLFKFKRL